MILSTADDPWLELVDIFVRVIAFHSALFTKRPFFAKQLGIWKLVAALIGV